MADPERFSDDSLEPMSKRGQGAVYTKTVDGNKLRDAENTNYRTYLLNQYYWPHHNKLEDLTEQALNNYDSALIIDAHSFPCRPLNTSIFKTVINQLNT